MAKLSNMFVQMMGDLGIRKERSRDVGDNGLGGHSSKCDLQMGTRKLRNGTPAEDAIIDLRRTAPVAEVGQGGWSQ